jgi:hypothetical protein
LYNTDHELVAEGHCQVDDDRGTVTLSPVFDTPTLSRQRGRMRLEMEDGSEVYVTDNVIRFRLNVPGQPGVAYRLSFEDKPPMPRLGGLA